MLGSILGKENEGSILIHTCSLFLMQSCSEQSIQLYVLALGPLIATEGNHLNVVFGEILKCISQPVFFKTESILNLLRLTLVFILLSINVFDNFLAIITLIVIIILIG